MTDTHEMERDPDGLYRLFVAAMADEPPPPHAQQQLVACERGLKRRRRRLAALAAAAAVAAAVLVPAALGDSDEPDQSPVDRSKGLTPEAMIATCRKGNQSDRATNAIFGSGTPEVRLSGTVAEMMSVVLMSANGQYWADCFINLYDGAEFTSGMTVYPAGGERRAKGFGYSSGFTCKDLDGPPSPPCRTFMVDYVDRVAEEVAAVSFDTADGNTTTVNAVGGFILFAYRGLVPEGYPTTESVGARHPRWLTRVTYLDETGEALAAEKLGDSRLERRRVAGLPLLEAYPARRSEPIW